MILHEVYFGKSKELIKAEEALDKYRAKYLNSYRDPRCLSDPDLKKYCGIMENEFGFGCFVMDINLVEVVNAGTMPVGKAIDIAPQFRLKRNLIKDTTGYKYNRKADYYYYMIMNSGLIFNPELTTEEVQAIIMHEIGHNFYTVTNKWGLYTSDAFFIMDIITAILSNAMKGNIDAAMQNIITIFSATNTAKKITVSIGDLVEKNPGLSSLFGFYSVIIGAVSDIGLNIQTILQWFLGIQLLPSSIMGGLLRYIGNPTGYANEKFADNFATMYGYGPALVSGLEKSESMGFNITANKVAQSSESLRLINYFYSAPISIISNLFDEHPQFIERARDQQRYLERELSKSDIDPKMKKKLLENSKLLNNKIDDYVNYRSKISPGRYANFKRDYQVILDGMFRGDFRHNFDLPSINLASQVDQMYKKTHMQ